MFRSKITLKIIIKIFVEGLLNHKAPIRGPICHFERNKRLTKITLGNKSTYTPLSKVTTLFFKHLYKPETEIKLKVIFLIKAYEANYNSFCKTSL